MPVSALKGSRSLTQGEGGRSPSLSLLLEALLWVFHNNRSGLCFQSYETIAEATHCARSTAAEAIRALGKGPLPGRRGDLEGLEMRLNP